MTDSLSRREVQALVNNGLIKAQATIQSLTEELERVTAQRDTTAADLGDALLERDTLRAALEEVLDGYEHHMYAEDRKKVRGVLRGESLSTTEDRPVPDIRDWGPGGGSDRQMT